MFVDAHCHIFTDRIVENVKAKPAMIEELKLNTRGAVQRLDPRALEESAEANAVDVCVLLPTASPERIRSENDRFVGFSREFPRLRTFATLHPEMQDLSGEIQRIFDLGINGFKFSSFSQRFDLSSPEVEAMLTELERLGRDRAIPPVLVFDTFIRADIHFGAQPDYLTTPSKLAELARRHEGLNVVGAHMGGLLADFDELRRVLLPAPNLYLDTANAAHTLEHGQFVELLRTHGASRILFGTDWPWFTHTGERALIGSLLTQAGYDSSEQAAVFGENAEGLLGL
ncbi:MAG: amidohydrolase family protein [Desulfomonile tiedjei]|nr:amidohydrolase family protein [Desulfomonile tiedjei]